MRVGNLPALLRPGPSRRGICLMTESDARNAEYFFAAGPKSVCENELGKQHDRRQLWDRRVSSALEWSWSFFKGQLLALQGRQPAW